MNQPSKHLAISGLDIHELQRALCNADLQIDCGLVELLISLVAAIDGQATLQNFRPSTGKEEKRRNGH